ncbi:MAG TPA: hypothetical protein VI036_12855, partial [Propionibacteriaceae bacterium]
SGAPRGFRRRPNPPGGATKVQLKVGMLLAVVAFALLDLNAVPRPTRKALSYYSVAAPTVSTSNGRTGLGHTLEPLEDFVAWKRLLAGLFHQHPGVVGDHLGRERPLEEVKLRSAWVGVLADLEGYSLALESD